MSKRGPIRSTCRTCGRAIRYYVAASVWRHESRPLEPHAPMPAGLVH